MIDVFLVVVSLEHVFFRSNAVLDQRHTWEANSPSMSSRHAALTKAAPYTL